MTIRYRAVLFSSVLIFALLFGAGCTSVAIGDVAYHNSSIIFPVTCTGEPSDAFVQVTVFTTQNFEQRELTTLQEPVRLLPGNNEVAVPANLPPGTYKLYLYVLRPGERETATIRDLVV
jgi:hypothetical protein